MKQTEALQTHQQTEDRLAIITLRQPWASLIALGLKRYETRSWATRDRGKIAIHAAKRLLYDDALEATWKAQELTGKKLNPVDFKYPLGCIVAIADLTNCLYMVANDGDPPPKNGQGTILIPSMTPLERAIGDWQQGRYAWKLENVIALPKPIPRKGAQGLRYANDELKHRIQEALAHG